MPGTASIEAHILASELPYPNTQIFCNQLLKAIAINLGMGYIHTIEQRRHAMNDTEVQGPPFPIEVINRRNGIQYGTKIKWVQPKKPKKAAA